MPYVKLLFPYSMEVNGTRKQFQKGDFIDIANKATVQRLINEKIAYVPDYNPLSMLPPDCGILATEMFTPPDEYKGLPVQQGSRQLPFHRTLLWDTGNVPFRTSLLLAGYHLLDVWELAVPIYDPDVVLAKDFGHEAARQYTESIIHDLRVPVYNTGLMFIRRCPNTELLMQAYEEYIQQDLGFDLAFLCALYRVKPLIYALPYTWLTIDGRDGHENE